MFWPEQMILPPISRSFNRKIGHDFGAVIALQDLKYDYEWVVNSAHLIF